VFAVNVQNTERDGLLIAGLVLLAILVYLPSFSNTFVLDDPSHILNNPAIEKWSFLWKGFVHEFHWFRGGEGVREGGNYRPLHAVVLGLSYHLFGRRPTGWHAELILFHALAVVAAFKSARVISSDRTVGAVTAAAFALMPIQVGAVAYCSAVQPLAGALLLCSFAAFVSRKGPKGLAVSVITYVAALLIYEGAIVLPVLIAAHGFLRTEARKAERIPGALISAQRVRAALVSAVPFIPPTLLYLGVRLWVLGQTVGSVSAMTPAEVLTTLPAAISTYILFAGLAFRGWTCAPACVCHHPSANDLIRHQAR
jgi:hypothetical protein